MPTQSATATPTPAQTWRDRVATALLGEEGGDDADDQRGLDALSQGDDQGWDQRAELPFASELRGP